MSATKVKVLPGTKFNVPHEVTISEFVYYRVYHNFDAIATKRPAYYNNIYIGRIRSTWATPPHTAGSLKLCLSSMESINPNQTELFASVSNQSALADEAPISLRRNQTLGIIPEDPVILVSKAKPQAKMERGTESLRVSIEDSRFGTKSPLAPRFLFYGVYSEAGARASKSPIDAEHPWLSKIDLNSILPPISVALLLHKVNVKEGINTSPQLLAQDGKNLGDDQIFTSDGNWLGASAEDHLVLKFGRPPFAEGSQYRIQNCCTGNSLVPPTLDYDEMFSLDAQRKLEHLDANYTLRLQYDGSVAFCNVQSRRWSPRSCNGFWLIPSTTNENYFFICEGDPFSPKAFYEPSASHRSQSYFTQPSAELDTTDTTQMWSIIPAVVPS